MTSKTIQIAAATVFLITLRAFAADPPYEQAIRLIKAIHGPDAELINPDTPLTPITVAFLDHNAAIFDLVHAGAAGSGFSPNGDMQSVLNQLNSVRSLANLEVVRARQRFSTQDPTGGEEDFLDALALGRNVDQTQPLLVSRLVQIGIEGMTLDHWAKLLPQTPAAQIAALTDRLKQLAAPVSMAKVIRAEKAYALTVLNAPDSTTPFYDSVSASLDHNPDPTPGEFRQVLDDGIDQISWFHPTSRKLASILVPSFARGYETIRQEQATDDMFITGIAIIQSGPAAVAKSSDPLGNGPFEYFGAPGHFELRSKGQLFGKPITLKFGY